MFHGVLQPQCWAEQCQQAQPTWGWLQVPELFCGSGHGWIPALVSGPWLHLAKSEHSQSSGAAGEAREHSPALCSPGRDSLGMPQGDGGRLLCGVCLAPLLSCPWACPQGMAWHGMGPSCQLAPVLWLKLSTHPSAVDGMAARLQPPVLGQLQGLLPPPLARPAWAHSGVSAPCQCLDLWLLALGKLWGTKSHSLPSRAPAE